MNDNNKNHRELRKFAFCGNAEHFQNHLIDLASLAQDEEWTHREDEPYHILKYYLYDTFDKLLADNKILFNEKETNACFNTGLLTNNSEEIVAYFTLNNRPESQKWYLKGFYKTSSREFMDNFNEIPKLVKYHQNYSDYYFNPEFRVTVNFEHILDENFDRIEKELGISSKGLLLTIFKGSWALTEPKISRNLRLVIPQYYKNKISYLIPIVFNLDNKVVTMALAAERVDNDQYRANTIFTIEMAYAQARILMKPEAEWIIKK